VLPKVTTALMLRQSTLPWCVGRKTTHGYELESRHEAYMGACDAARYSAQRIGLDRTAYSVSHVNDGAELWPLEKALNRLNELRQVELHKVTPDLQRLEAMTRQITGLYEEAVVLADGYGKLIRCEWNGCQVRLSFRDAPVGGVMWKPETA
jgi:hypothetical protein